MRPLLRFLCVLAAAFAVAGSALSQENFPDVPKGHWAYREVAELRKEGLLKGYPDGLFRGGRPASRYELAVAIHAAWSKQKGVVDGLSEKVLDTIRRLEAPITTLDPKHIREVIERARAQKDLNSQDIASLKRLIAELKPELDNLRKRINEAKIASLDSRIDRLEKRKPGG
jgi:hypothetical protein